MSKKTKLILFALMLIIVGGVITWMFVNQGNTDHANKKASATFALTEIMSKSETDTASLNKLKDQLILINGPIKNIKRENNDVTIELGDSNTLSSMICQMDQRHLAETNELEAGQLIRIKGKFTGYTLDELGLGNTLEMNFCSIEK
jgi:Tfp pilus assembly protein PilO